MGFSQVELWAPLKWEQWAQWEYQYKLLKITFHYFVVSVCSQFLTTEDQTATGTQALLSYKHLCSSNLKALCFWFLLSTLSFLFLSGHCVEWEDLTLPGITQLPLLSGVTTIYLTEVHTYEIFFPSYLSAQQPWDLFWGGWAPLQC